MSTEFNKISPLPLPPVSTQEELVTAFNRLVEYINTGMVKELNQLVDTYNQDAPFVAMHTKPNVNTLRNPAPRRQFE